MRPVRYRGFRKFVLSRPQGGQKLILALDEYEKLHDLLAEDPVRGGRLLGAEV
jgi:hypothetical protein